MDGPKVKDGTFDAKFTNQTMSENQIKMKCKNDPEDLNQTRIFSE